MTEAYDRALLLAEVGRFGDAERALRSALAEAPGDSRLLTLLAHVLRRTQRYPEALDACDAAISADPSRAAVHAERAECLIALLRDADAIAAASESVRLAPWDAAAHLVLARACNAASRHDEARAAASRGLSLAPRDPDALVTLADVERDAGNGEEAESLARAALEVDPANRHARWLLAMLDAERFRVRRSLRTLSDVARDHPASPDVISMAWPVRSLLHALRRWFSAAVVVVALAALAATRWSFVLLPARVAAGLFAAVVAGFALRVLVPAGELPWRSLRAGPRLLRRATVAGAVTVAFMSLTLILYAVTPAFWLPLLALAAVPPLWILWVAEALGARMDDPGYRHALAGIGRDLRRDLAKTWHDFKAELRKTG